jgi:hypothetical protein
MKSVGFKLLALSVSLCILSGCSVAKVASSKQGIDVTRIEVGISGAETEAVLGKPVKEWKSDTGVLYCTYRYDLGHKPSPRDASFMGFMDVATFGLWEAFMSSRGYGYMLSHDFNRVLISYDEQGRIIGIFGEFDPLPPDGHSTKYKSLREFEQAVQDRKKKN